MNSDTVMRWLIEFKKYKKDHTVHDIAMATNLDPMTVRYILKAMATLGHVIVINKSGAPCQTRYRVFTPHN